MVVMIAAGLLLVGIAFYQTIQGLFSAMIMAILTVLCAAAAFNYYEPLANLLVERQGAYAHPVALLALFVVPLLALRIIIDRLIPGNMVINVWADRVGGVVFGLVTGLVIVGVLLVIVQLLPLPGTFLFYQPYDATLSVKDAGPSAWAGQFTLGLMKQLSAGALSPLGQGRDFARAHSDLLLEAFAVRNAPPGVKVSAVASALEASEAFVVLDPNKEAGRLTAEEKKVLDKLSSAEKADLARVLANVPEYPLLDPVDQRGKTKVVVVRVQVDQSARDDRTSWYVLPGTHFRLLTAGGQSYYPVGYLTYAGTWKPNTVVESSGARNIAQLADILVARPWQLEGGPPKLTVDWVYRLPLSEQPERVIFRRTSASAELAVISGLPAPKAQGGVAALNVQGTYGRVMFAPPPAGSIFQAEHMEASDRMLGVQGLPKSDRPAIVKTLELEGDRIKQCLLDGQAGDLNRAFQPGTQFVNTLLAPKGQQLINVRLKTAKDAKPPPDIWNFLQTAKPALLLDDGSTLAHKGAALQYDAGSGAGGKMLVVYYDVGRPNGPLDERLLAGVRDNFGTVEFLELVFAAPADEKRSIVSVRFGKAEYEFMPTSPLLLRK